MLLRYYSSILYKVCNARPYIVELAYCTASDFAVSVPGWLFFGKVSLLFKVDKHNRLSFLLKSACVYPFHQHQSIALLVKIEVFRHRQLQMCK